MLLAILSWKRKSGECGTRSGELRDTGVNSLTVIRSTISIMMMRKMVKVRKKKKQIMKKKTTRSMVQRMKKTQSSICKYSLIRRKI